MSSSCPSPIDYLTDPLSPLTRAERRNLLFASFVGVLISKAGLVPTKISAFGIDLSAPQQSAFTFVTSLVVIYFLIAFVSYALPDFLTWRKKHQDYLESVEILGRNWTQEDQMAHDEVQVALPSIRWLYRSSPSVACIRLLFDCVIPILFAGYSIYALVGFKAGP